MVRPLPTRRRFAVRALSGSILGIATLLVAGCADPNFIGVQDYGSIQGNVVDGSGHPVNDALVYSGPTVVHTVPDGSFTLIHIPVGEQPIMVSAGGSAPNNDTTVIVKKDQTVSAGNIAIATTTNAPSSPATNRP